MINKIKSLAKKYIAHQQKKTDSHNRLRLVNNDVTLISSNCAGGIIYHALGLQFRSPFINLFLNNEDFIFVLEHFENFIKEDIIEDKESTETYPVGIGLGGARIHFMHYSTFEEAIEKWNERKNRIDINNMAIMFTNFTGDYSVLQKFEQLPYPNKVVFTEKEYPEIPSAVCLKGFAEYSRLIKKMRLGVPNIWQIRNPFTCKRFIDQFDYVDFFNRIKDKK